MGFIDHDHGVVLLGEGVDLVQRTYVAVHREHTVGNDDAVTLCLGLLKAFLQLGHVSVGIAVSLGLAQTHAVDDGGVVERVGYDGVLLVQKRLEHTAVGIEACGIEDGVLSAEELCDLGLEGLLQVTCTADETHAGHTVAVGVHGILGGLYEFLAVGKSEVVVGAEVQGFGAVLKGNLRTLGRHDYALFLVQSCFLDAVQLVLKIGLKIFVHNAVYLVWTQS